jgi:hypothetical protein
VSDTVEPDILDEYLAHPEPKSLAPYGSRCQRETSGLLGRRPLTPMMLTHLGKEANSLDEVEAGFVAELGEILNEYPRSFA